MQVFTINNVQMTAQLIKPSNPQPWDAAEYLEITAPVRYSLEGDLWKIQNKLKGSIGHYSNSRILQSFQIDETSTLRLYIDP